MNFRLALYTVLFLSIFGLVLEAAEAAPYQFAGIPSDASISEIKNLMEKAGFVFDKVDEDGDLNFKGKLKNYPASAFVFMTANNAVVKIQISIATPDHVARTTYAELVDDLKKKYGKPTSEFELFTRPYYKGDGYEDQAIRLGKAKYATFWTMESAESNLGVQITDNLAVALGYEYPGWSAEYERRKALQREIL